MYKRQSTPQGINTGEIGIFAIKYHNKNWVRQSATQSAVWVQMNSGIGETVL